MRTSPIYPPSTNHKHTITSTMPPHLPSNNNTNTRTRACLAALQQQLPIFNNTRIGQRATTVVATHRMAKLQPELYSFFRDLPQNGRVTAEYHTLTTPLTS